MSVRITDVAPFPRAEEILTPEATEFIAELHRRFNATRLELLTARAKHRAEASMTGSLEFPAETAGIREAAWQVAPLPAALTDRRAEVIGPASPANLVVNYLNSGAKVWLADLEDANTPTWHNVLDCILNLKDAAEGTLEYADADGTVHGLRKDAPLAVVVARLRGWHLDERHLLVDGEPVSGALVDFGLHFFHTAKTLLSNGRGPYYYLSKIESYFEARLWNEVFVFAQEYLGVAQSSIRATVLIETIPAAFQMEEILYELRDHAAGLNAGRWDYLFSIIKYFHDAGEAFVLPDRASVSMTDPFLKAYTDLVVATAHKRGASAIGGLAAVIPDASQPEVTEQGIKKVQADKSREARDGFDGSWVAHQDLIPFCWAEFEAVLGADPNQISRPRPKVSVTAEQLLDIRSSAGTSTEAGLRANLHIAIAYTASWLSGKGAATINNLMEDVATAEVCRAQVWQQIRNAVVLSDTGNTVTKDLVSAAIEGETNELRAGVGEDEFRSFYLPASRLIGELTLSESLTEYLTVPASELLA